MANKRVHTLIFIFAMNIKIAWSVYECADCDKNSIGTCNIHVEDGFSCGVYKLRKQPRRQDDEDYYFEMSAMAADAEVPELTTDLGKCVPKGLNVTGDFPICCVWSKELGCQLLTSNENDLWDCGICRKNMHITYDDLKPCPCVGSRKVYCGLWLVMIAIYYMFALFKL